MFNYRKTLVAGAFLGAVSMVTPALAADPTYWDQPTSSFNWSGFYAGAHGGWGSGDYDYVFPSASMSEPRRAAASAASRQATTGISAGSSWVRKATCPSVASRDGPPAPIRPSPATRASTSCPTIRGRVGLPIDNFMPYVTAGVAFGNVRRHSSNGVTTLSDSRTLTGWTAGLGAEVRRGRRLVAGRRVSLCRPGKKDLHRRWRRLLGCPHRHPYAHLPPQGEFPLVAVARVRIDDDPDPASFVRHLEHAEPRRPVRAGGFLLRQLGREAGSRPAEKFGCVSGLRPMIRLSVLCDVVGNDPCGLPVLLAAPAKAAAPLSRGACGDYQVESFLHLPFGFNLPVQALIRLARVIAGCPPAPESASALVPEGQDHTAPHLTLRQQDILGRQKT